MEQSVIDTEFKLIKDKINNDIHRRCIEASAYLDLKINSIATKEITTEKVDEVQIFTTLIKRMGYSKYCNMFSKNFVLVELIGHAGTISEIKVKHDIPGMKTKWHVINESHLSSLMVFVNYFERL